MIQPPAIVCALDDRYALPAATMLCSLAANLNRYPSADIYILHDQLLPSNRARIVDSIDSNRLRLHWIKTSDELNDLKVDGHISRATYYRLLLDGVVNNRDRALYIDCDTIIKSDVSELWDTAMDDSTILAVPQVSPRAATAGSSNGLPLYRELGIKSGHPLFNAGVLLVNLNKWRAIEASDRIIHYLRLYRERVLWWDQDGLNAVLWNEWRPLDYRWNLMISLFRYFNSWEETPFEKDAYERLVREPSIVHFNSTSKPWHADYKLPYAPLFFAYVDQTVWRNWRPCQT